MKPVTLTFTLTAILIGVLLLCSRSKDFFSGLFFVPASLGPLFVTLLFAACWSSKRAQIALLVSTLLYCAWFTYGYLDIFYIHLDPQSAIGLLLIGPISLPVMAVFWIVAGCSPSDARISRQSA